MPRAEANHVPRVFLRNCRTKIRKYADTAPRRDNPVRAYCVPGVSIRSERIRVLPCLSVAVSRRALCCAQLFPVGQAALHHRQLATALRAGLLFDEVVLDAAGALDGVEDGFPRAT